MFGGTVALLGMLVASKIFSARRDHDVVGLDARCRRVVGDGHRRRARDAAAPPARVDRSGPRRAQKLPARPRRRGSRPVRPLGRDLDRRQGQARRDDPARARARRRAQDARGRDQERATSTSRRPERRASSRKRDGRSRRAHRRRDRRRGQDAVPVGARRARRSAPVPRAHPRRTASGWSRACTTTSPRSRSSSSPRAGLEASRVASDSAPAVKQLDELSADVAASGEALAEVGEAYAAAERFAGMRSAMLRFAEDHARALVLRQPRRLPDATSRPTPRYKEGLAYKHGGQDRRGDRGDAGGGRHESQARDGVGVARQPLQAEEGPRRSRSTPTSTRSS